ncbi:GntR family transcriptional regulator [Clostridium sp.]|uniref:GntR family transcriptional regulator n=1 Tax=Clostridium sp. TaxID=1506 RepID=UPI00346437CB
MNNLFNKVNANDIRPIRQIVLENLRVSILSGKLKAGDRLIETAVAEAMGVSRTPVREALRQLELEGLADNMPRKGTIVRGMPKEEALDIYDLRAIMEGLATKLCCINISRKEISELRDIIEDMEKALINKDTDRFISIHSRWNEVIINASRNKYLIKSIQQIYEYLLMLRTVSLYSDESKTVALKEHKEILEAIEVGDEELSEALARRHVENAKKRFING